jgi:hypothetical protein
LPGVNYVAFCKENEVPYFFLKLKPISIKSNMFAFVTVPIETIEKLGAFSLGVNRVANRVGGWNLDV